MSVLKTDAHCFIKSASEKIFFVEHLRHEKKPLCITLYTNVNEMYTGPWHRIYVSILKNYLMATMYIFSSILATIETFSRIFIHAQESLSREQQITAWVSQNTALVTIVIAALLFYALTKDSFGSTKRDRRKLKEGGKI